MRRVKEEHKDQATSSQKDIEKRTDLTDEELTSDKQLSTSKKEEKKKFNEEINVFKEPNKDKDVKEVNKQEGKEVNKKTNTFLHLPLDSNVLLNNSLSPDTSELILPPPSSPVNPAYSLKQRSRNKRYKIERRLNSFSNKNSRQNNSSDDSDQPINQGSSNDEEDENDDGYANSSVNQSSAEEELIDLESSDEKIGKLYTESDLEKLFSKTVEQKEENELKNDDKKNENDSNYNAQSNQTSNSNNLLTVQHSHSSEKLKSLDSQSLPNSPTVLSSAASSATLVASPLNKVAPGSLGESFDKDNETNLQNNNQSKETTLKDNNNNSFKPQSTVSFSNQVDTKSIFEPNQPSQSQHYPYHSSKTNTPKHTSQPQYFLWNQQHQPNYNPFVSSNVDYQPHHKLSTTSTTSGASMNYLRVKGTKNLIDNHNFLDSLNTTPRSSFQADYSAHTTPRSSFQLSDSQQMMSSKAGVVVTSSRNSTRRSSSASASAAFAVATAASSMHIFIFK